MAEPASKRPRLNAAADVPGTTHGDAPTVEIKWRADLASLVLRRETLARISETAYFDVVSLGR